jgi:hypothetical protein
LNKYRSRRIAQLSYLRGRWAEHVFLPAKNPQRRSRRHGTRQAVLSKKMTTIVTAPLVAFLMQPDFGQSEVSLSFSSSIKLDARHIGKQSADSRQSEEACRLLKGLNETELCSK